MRQRLTVLCLLLMSFASVDAQTTKPSPGPSPAQTSEQLKELRAEISRLQDSIIKLERRLQFQELLMKSKQETHDLIYLNTSEHSYQKLDTATGVLLVSLDDVVPYLNGYKIHISIGNPSSASYAGYKIKIRWAKAYDYNKYTEASYNEWDKSAQEREISFTDKLESGVWNPAELILTPATADQLEYLILSISTSVVSLRRISQ